MTISPEMLIAVASVIGTVVGALSTGLVAGLYWMVKLRNDVDRWKVAEPVVVKLVQDVNAAHAALRELKKPV